MRLFEPEVNQDNSKYLQNQYRPLYFDLDLIFLLLNTQPSVAYFLSI